MASKPVEKVEAVDLKGINILEVGIAPVLAAASEDAPEEPGPTGPTPPDTLPG